MDSKAHTHTLPPPFAVSQLGPSHPLNAHANAAHERQLGSSSRKGGSSEGRVSAHNSLGSNKSFGSSGSWTDDKPGTGESKA